VDLENQSNSPIHIDRFDTTCGCLLSVDPTSITIEPKSSATAKLSLDLRKAFLGEWDELPREFSTLLIPVVQTSDGFSRPAASLTIHGTVKRAFKKLPKFFGIQGTWVTGDAERSEKLRVEADEAIESLDAEIPKRFGESQVRRIGNGNWEINLSLVRVLEPGPLTFEVKLIGRIGKSPAASTSVPFCAEIEKPVRALPSALAFGAVKVGETVSARIQFTQARGGIAFVDHWESPTPEIKLIRAGESQCEVLVAPASPGQMDTTLAFFCRADHADKLVRVVVPVRYCAVTFDK